jgi:hypothetical protein
MAVSSGNPVQEGDDDESDDGECGGGDHGDSLGELRLASDDCFRNSRARSRTEWRGVAPDPATVSLDCMKIRR